MHNFLPKTIQLAQYYRALGEKAINQLDDDELKWSPGSSSNSIGIIVKHLWGNMLSRWTNFLKEDGEKSWRQRDAEFENAPETRNEIMSKWDEGWGCFIDTLESLSEEDLSKTVYIRNEGHSVMDAIQRQMAHYPYHIGQIVFIGKLLKGDDWKSLSIPKGASGQFNDRKFSANQKDRDFTGQI